MAEFYMPSLGADMEAGTLIEWKVKPGDRITRGDIIAEVETDKGIIEVEVFDDGIVDQILVQPDAKVPVGTVLATILPVGAPPMSAAEGAVAERMPVAAPPQAQPSLAAGGPRIQAPAMAPPAVTTEKRLRVSPLARKLAADLGVDLSTVQGTGPDGAIERADVERAAAASKAEERPPAPTPPPSPAAPEVAPTPEAPPAVEKPAAPEFQARMPRPGFHGLKASVTTIIVLRPSRSVPRCAAAALMALTDTCARNPSTASGRQFTASSCASSAGPRGGR